MLGMRSVERGIGEFDKMKIVILVELYNTWKIDKPNKQNVNLNILWHELREENDEERSDEIVDALHIARSRVTDCPNVQNSLEHLNWLK